MRKRAISLALAALVVVTLAVAAAASEPSIDISSIMSDGVTKVQGDLFSVLAIVVPAIIIVVGAIIGIRFGITWIKKIRG